MMLIGLPAPTLTLGELLFDAGPSLPHVGPESPGPQVPGGVGGTMGGMLGTQLVLGGQAGGNPNPGGMPECAGALKRRLARKRRGDLDNIEFI